MPDDTRLATLTDADQEALHAGCGDGIGSTVTDVEPLAGGSQNIVVRLGSTAVGWCCGGRQHTRGRRATRRCCARSRCCARWRARRYRTRVHRRLRRPRRARRGVLPDGGGRRLQPRQRDSRGLRPRRRHAAPGRAGVRGRPGAARHVAWQGSPLAASGGRDPFWRARFRSSCGCWRAIGTSTTARVLPAVGSWPSGWIQPAAGRRTRHHARRCPPQQRVVASRDAGAGGIHRLGDVHDGDPLLDLGWMLVCWPPSRTDQRRLRAGCTRRAGDSGRTARGLLEAGPDTSGWTGTSRWRVSSSASSSRDLVSIPGRASELGGRRAAARVGEELIEGHPGGQGRRPVRVTLTPSKSPQNRLKINDFGRFSRSSRAVYYLRSTRASTGSGAPSRSLTTR